MKETEADTGCNEALKANPATGIVSADETKQPHYLVNREKKGEKRG